MTELPKFSDKRGFLIEFLKSTELSAKEFGQIYLATIEPGHIRGNHFHNDKNEWICIMHGKAKMVLEDVNTKERAEFDLDTESNKIIRIKIPTNIAHAIKNVSDNIVVLIAYTEKLYDPKTLHKEDYLVIE